ncbi:putative maltose permease [Microdochium trichocladiopsis]|uniref:Maltose permease n=1 Tax=Microdochium trichocladiopsis TaxID=1682393 RepID=A0A9P8YH22_9PEZI|nr:putative maltose permease [Microdochium trichocladiopsis]KAH7041567.1 putative maltose permease [Microdochium trichocladiopsis]
MSGEPKHETSAKADVLHDEGVPGDQHLADLSNEEERSIGKWAAIRKNPWAFAWCLYGVWAIMLVSFENQAAGIVVGIPQFRKDFGFLFEGNYVLDTNWQAAFSGAPGASMFFGAIGAGQIADWIGRRNTIAGALVVSFAAITLEVVASTNEMFFGGKFLNGFATGILQSVAGSYVGEIVPLALRGLTTCLIALSFTLGPFIVALIVNFHGDTGDAWSYRAVFCAQYGFAVIAAVFVFLMPESPWWLVSKGREDKALKSLNRLGYSSVNGEAAKRLANIKVTLEEVKQETDGATYAECFRRSNLRHTIVSITPLVAQQFTGIVFAASYSTYYAQLAGYSVEDSFKLQIVQQVLSMLGNVISWQLIDTTGRRTLTLYGTIGLTAVLWVMGGLAVGGTVQMLRGAVAMILLYCFLYNVTIGASAYVCLAETATSRLRVKTFAIGVAVNSLFGVFWSFVLPYLFNPDRANLGGKLGFVFGGLCFPTILFIWWYQPETRLRSYEELDEMFMKQVPARKFRGYVTESQRRGETARAVENAAAAEEKV